MRISPQSTSIGLLFLMAPLAALAQIAPEEYTLVGVAVRSRPA